MTTHTTHEPTMDQVSPDTAARCSLAPRSPFRASRAVMMEGRPQMLPAVAAPIDVDFTPGRGGVVGCPNTGGSVLGCIEAEFYD